MRRKKALLLLNTIFFGGCLFYALTTYYLHQSHDYISPSHELTHETVQRRPGESKKRHPNGDDHPHPSPEKAVKFFRYDAVGPKITHASTHYLSSIPRKHRLNLPPSEKYIASDQEVEQFFDTIRNDYASLADNVFPQKLHLYEINPSITKLPEHYRTNKDWRRVFGQERLPYYVASYRVTHEHNCYDDNTTVKLMGDSWANIRDRQTDYLGISIMDDNLNILVDTTVDVNLGIFDIYGDFRLFNLGEQLYLTTFKEIVPISLTLSVTQDNIAGVDERGCGPNIPQSFQEIPPAFRSDDANTRPVNLRIWIRNFSSCSLGASLWKLPGKGAKHKKKAVEISGKNLLYFGRNISNNGTDKANVIVYMKHNPSEVETVDLAEKCIYEFDEEVHGFAKVLGEGYDDTPGPMQPRPTFETVDALKYPKHKFKDLFVDDRGSACCTTVKTRSILPISMQMTTLQKTTIDVNLDIHDVDELLVAIVHPKTKYPGKQLPKGVTPNTYLSRFVAFVPREPYTIVAKSGIFCLGYPNREMDSSTENPLEFVQMNRLHFANETYNCPRIHFVTGMIDSDESDSVIISYGVSDCLSRFVAVPKSEIIRMLTPGAST